MTSRPHQPREFEDEPHLIDFMTAPSAELVSLVAMLPRRVVVLGAGGKMGPTLCIRLARAVAAAGRSVEIVAVSRFSDAEARSKLEAHGVTIAQADLLDPEVYNALPDAELVYYLVGQKFGTSDAPHRTWSTNAVIPTFVCRRYRGAQIVALSTGNVYPMSTPDSGGSVESDSLHPIGEYAASCVGRERVFEHFAVAGDCSVVLVRLNYAIDMRYGVLNDIAQRINADQPIDVSTGYFNCIWQGDANDIVLRSASLLQSSQRGNASHLIRLNVTGPGIHGVRAVASELADLLEKEVAFVGSEQATALLSNASLMVDRFGAPSVQLGDMVQWTAAWTRMGGTVWSKPTHFETRDGAY